MNALKIRDHIVAWLRTRIEESGTQGFVVGVSGGVDSAVTATLCATTGFPTLCVSLPILQVQTQYARSIELSRWLEGEHSNVTSAVVDLSEAFTTLCRSLPEGASGELALVNTRSRLRMTTLYAFANSQNRLVCGTGNKVEDYGIGFFTKYGDGGVDVSPIGDLLKSDVFALAAHLGVPDSIQQAAPTDGLWEVDRTDEEQIGATYAELEWAMDYTESVGEASEDPSGLTTRQGEVLAIYRARHDATAHKMEMPPVCEIPFLR